MYMCLILTSLYLCQPARRLADGQLKSRTKNVFFFEKNAVGRATFAGRPTMTARLITHV